MAKIKIENIVASTSVEAELDLEHIAKVLPGCQYNSAQFPGLVLRIPEPKTAALLFRSGRIVCTGAKSLEDLKRAISTAVAKIASTGVKVTKNPQIDVQNIVASASLGAVLNLNAIVSAIGLDHIEYEPEQFPGLVYRMAEPKVVMLLFGSGKLVCTGARNPKDAEVAVDKIHAELKKLGIIGKA